MISNLNTLHLSFRFQILRDLVPNSNQKRDTASFLLEVSQLHTKKLQWDITSAHVLALASVD